LGHYIDRVQIGNTTYDIQDTWARRVVQGIGTVYATSVDPSWYSYTSNIRYKDVLTDQWYGSEISGAGQIINSSLAQNGAGATDRSITNSSAGKYLVLLGDPGTPPSAIGGDTGRYVIALKDLKIGDTVYVKESNITIPSTYKDIPDYWVSVAGKESTTVATVFTPLDAKIDTSTLVTKGTYNTSGPNKNYTDSVGGQTDWADIGTATGSGDISGLAPTVTESKDLGTKNTSNNGAHTINGSNFTFTGTTATLTSNVSVSDHAAQTLTISGSQSVGNHSHSIGSSTTSLTYVSDVTITASVDNHTHSISGTRATQTVVTGVDGNTGNAGGHSHTVNRTESAKTVVTAVDANTGNESAHTHSVTTHDHDDSVIVLTNDSTFSAGTTPSFGTIGTTVTKGAYGFTTNAAYAFTSNSAYALSSSIVSTPTTGTGLLYNPTVSEEGILSFSYAAANTQASRQASTEVVTNVTAFRNGTWSAGTTPSFTKSTATVAGDVNVATLTTSGGSAHSHSIGKSTSTVNNITNITLTAVADHSHSIGKSTTSITYVSTVTVTGSAGGHSHTITPTKATQTVVTSVDANTGNAGAHTVQGSNFSAALPTLTHNVTNGNFNYQPAGTIGGSQSVSSHTHSVTLGAHTHEIKPVSGTISISVAVGSHSHAVNSHSHTLSNHTHSVTL